MKYVHHPADRLFHIPATSYVDETVLVYGRADLLRIGEHTRIDAHCVISVGPDGVEVGDYCHLAVGVCLFGSSAPVRLGDCCYASPRATILTATDGLADDCLVGPTVPAEYRRVRTGPVVFEDGAGVGAGAVVLPGVTLGLGAAAGALSVVKESVPAGHVVVGPVQRVVRVKDVAKIKQLLEALRCESRTPAAG